MDRDADDAHDRLVGGEGLVGHLADVAAVEGIGGIDREVARQVGMHAAPDLLVGREGEADRAVRDLGVREQVAGDGHHDGDAGLVVGAEQRRAAGGDDVVADLSGQVGRLLGRQHKVGRVGEADRAAVVAAVHDRLHAGGVELRRGVDMREQPDGRGRLGQGRRQRREERAVAGQPDVARPHRRQLVAQHVEERELPLAARRGRRGVVALRVDRRVADQPLLELAVEVLLHRGPLARYPTNQVSPWSGQGARAQAAGAASSSAALGRGFARDARGLRGSSATASAGSVAGSACGSSGSWSTLSSRRRNAGT